ncbi:MAG: hypothetical protein ACOCV8_03850 [Spirochaetota bacterium]
MLIEILLVIICIFLFYIGIGIKSHGDNLGKGISLILDELQKIKNELKNKK